MERPFIDQFGFDVVTCCGYLPQVSDTCTFLHLPTGKAVQKQLGKHTLSLFGD